MAQVVECLPKKHGTLSSVPQDCHPPKNIRIVVSGGKITPVEDLEIFLENKTKK
jgi:hypothetical protein